MKIRGAKLLIDLLVSNVIMILVVFLRISEALLVISVTLEVAA